MSSIKKRRSLALLFGAVLIALPVWSFAGVQVSQGGDHGGSPSAPDGSEVSPGGDSNPSPYVAETDGYPGDDTGSPPPYPCSTYDPCSPSDM